MVNGTGINSEKAVSFISGKVFFGNAVLVLTFRKGLIVFLCGKERLQSSYFKFQFDVGGEFLYQCGKETETFLS